MTEETKMLLKLILAQEEASEAGQKVLYKKSTKNTKAESAAEDSATSKPVTLEDFRKADMERARRDLYTPHEAVNDKNNSVPIWAKYALSLPEASAYFHIGYNKLREIVRKDKYAEYLIWNGGRVYIKRALFEEYLNKETEL